MTKEIFYRTVLLLLLAVACMGGGLQASKLDSLVAAVESMPNSGEKARSLIELATSYQTIDPAKAVQFSLMAVEMARSMDSTFLEGMAGINVGTSYFYKGDYGNALEAYGNSLEIMKGLGSKSYIAKIYINLGSVYINMGNFAQAESMLSKGKLYTEPGSNADLILNSNLAIVYTNQEEYDKALQLHSDNLKYFAEDDHRTRSLTYNNIGYIYEIQGDASSGNAFYMRALEEARLAGSNYEKGYALTNVASSLIELNRYREAENYLDTLIPVAREQGEPRMIAEAFRLRAVVAEKKGDLPEALARFRDYMNLKDSLNTANQNEKIAELQSKLDIASRDAEIKVMEKENELMAKQQAEERAQQEQQALYIWLLGGGIVLLLAVLGVLAWLFLSRNRAMAKLHESASLIQDQYELLRLQKELLEDANREKDGLIGVVAHDLKSPLSKTMALTQLVLDSGALKDAQENALRMVLRTNESAHDLIRDLLDLHSIEQQEERARNEDIQLGAFFQEVRDSFEAQAKRKDIRIHWPAEAASLRIVSNRTSLSRILDNLLSNAIKFSPKGKEIHVSALQNGDGDIQISVRDDGPGISEADQRKLFKRFQRLSARPTAGESSTGLGLAITKTLVEKMGGSISLQSSLGQGAEFTVKLPSSL